MRPNRVLILGHGQIGRTIERLCKESGFRVSWIDKTDRKVIDTHCDILHVCFPQKEMDEFVVEVLKTTAFATPQLVIINSTVLPGTTREIKKGSIAKDFKIVHSPCQGQHTDLYKWIRRHTKWIGPIGHEAGKLAEKHFRQLGLTTKVVGKPETTELVKLLDVTQFTVLINWAQEADRICKENKVSHIMVREFGKEVQEFLQLRPFITPGVAGGHCLIPDLELLMKIHPCKFFDAMMDSNERKKEEERKENVKINGEEGKSVK